MLLGLHWPTMIVTALIWIGTALVTRYSSLSALVASAAAPIVLLAFGLMPEAVLALLLTIIIWVRHRANMQRLMAGEETRIGGARSKP